MTYTCSKHGKMDSSYGCNCFRNCDRCEEPYEPGRDGDDRYCEACLDYYENLRKDGAE